MGDPIKRNLCQKCGQPNRVGEAVCKHCGGTCESVVIGYSRDEDPPEEASVLRKPDSGDRIIGL